MNKIVCRIDAGLGKQHILFYKDEKLEYEESVSIDILINWLINVCYTENCYNIHFMGNQQYIQGLVQELSTEEITKYNTHKILIEVN